MEDFIGIDRLCRPPYFVEHDIAYEKMYGRKFFALYSDLGTAKTFMLIREFMAMWQVDLIDGLLIIAPVGVHRQWVEEEWGLATNIDCVGAAWPELPSLEKTSKPRIFALYPEAFRVKRRKLGNKEKQKERMDKLRERQKEGQYDSQGLWNLCKKYLRSGRIGVIVDEAQCMKNLSSNTYRRIRAFKPLATYRRVASGFPAPQGLVDYLPQYMWLSTKILDCHSMKDFDDKFSIMKKQRYGSGPRFKVRVGYKNEDEFTKRVAPYTFTVDIDKCHLIDKNKPWSMPGRSWEVLPVELSAEQTRLIEQIKKEFRATLKDKTILMPLALQRLTRIQQIACGFLPKLDDEGKPIGGVQTIRENRTDALDAVLDRIRGKVIIWSRFTYCTDRLTKHLGSCAVRYRGGDKKEMTANFERFKRDPKCTRLVAQPDSIGAGFNGLTISRHSIYWSNNPNAQFRRQTERRIWRIGQSQACWYGDICAKGTFDTKIRDALINKQNVADAIRRDIAAWVKV